MNRQPANFYEFGVYRLDQAERLLSREGEAAPLPPKAFDLLLALVERPGHLFEKEELMRLVWPDTFVEEANLTYTISLVRKTLGDNGDGRGFIETVPKHGYRFVAEVRQWRAESAPLKAPWTESAEASRVDLEPVGGAMPLDSKFYIARSTDEQFRAAISRQDSIVLIKGARQVGKTSLLSRGLRQSREAGARVVLTDFQMLNEENLSSVESLFLTLAELIAYRLDLEVRPRVVWDPLHSPNFNFERYLERYALEPSTGSIVWAIDEVDRLFTRPFAGEIFGLFRSWHNSRSLDPDGPWRRLTLVMAYATEAHLFISDLNQSPFNVGTRLTLEDFDLWQISDLNHRYSAPLRNPNEIERYFHVIGGNPYLAQRGLCEMARRGLALSELESIATSDNGPFGDHLRRLMTSLAQDQSMCDVIRGMLTGAARLSAESFYRLRSAGVIAGATVHEARLRCQLYTTYLKEHLL